MKALLIIVPSCLVVASAAWAQSDQVQPSHTVVPISAPADRGDTATARSMTDALNTLEAKGMGAFSNFHQNGAGASATISQDGSQYDVTVDPNTAQIARQP